MTPADFAGLAALMQREKFFDLNESYSDPVLDAAQVTITAVADARRKAVANYAEAGPPNLKRLEDAISALARKSPA